MLPNWEGMNSLLWLCLGSLWIADAAEQSTLDHVRTAAVLVRRYITAAGLHSAHAEAASPEALACAGSCPYVEYAQRKLDFDSHSDNVSDLERRLFPWLKSPVGELQKSFRGRGIVLAVGDRYVPLAVHLVRSLRAVFMSELPIEVFYDGARDLSAAHVSLFGSMENVTPVDISQLVDSQSLRLQGWDIKPFALLLSSFAEALFLDADAVLFQPPSSFFVHERFGETGALFFHDRHIFWEKPAWGAWLRSVLPDISARAAAAPVFCGRASNHMDSGAIAVDKSRALGGLLMACVLNAPPIRAEVHRHTHGDKETFWLGFEMASVPYAFHAGLAAHVGRSPSATGAEAPGSTFEGLLCGSLAHLDDHGRLWWANDGISAGKTALGGGPLRSLVHKTDASCAVWESRGGVSCLWGRVTVLSDLEGALVDRMAPLWDPFPAGYFAAIRAAIRPFALISLGLTTGIASGLLMAMRKVRYACQ